QPFTCISYLPDPAIQLRCARNFAQQMKLDRLAAARGASGASAKIKVAYLSGDFCEHAVAPTIPEMLELPDRARFEVIGVSFGPDDGSEMRARLVRAFDQFHDVKARSDPDAASLLAGLKIDMAVDLMGYTLHSRPGILARRPAPIQVNY